MAFSKQVLRRDRLRRVPPQFSWLDHRLVRDRHLRRCSVDALALYLFLVVVCDGQGLSYYSDRSISELLPLDEPAIDRARQRLVAAGLVAYKRPLYQVLSLDPPRSVGGSSPALSLGEILKSMENP